jgi:hypothetical protein
MSNTELLQAATTEQQKNFTALKEELDVDDTVANVVDEEDMKVLEKQWVVLSEKLTKASESVIGMIKWLRWKMGLFIADWWDMQDTSITVANALIVEMESFQKKIQTLQERAKTHISAAYAVSTTKEWAGPTTTKMQAAVGNEKFVAGAEVTTNKDMTTMQATVIRNWHQATVATQTNKLTWEKMTSATVAWWNVNLFNRTRGQWVQAARPWNPQMPEQIDIATEKQLPPEEKNKTPDSKSEQKIPGTEQIKTG